MFENRRVDVSGYIVLDIARLVNQSKKGNKLESLMHFVDSVYSVYVANTDLGRRFWHKDFYIFLMHSDASTLLNTSFYLINSDEREGK